MNNDISLNGYKIFSQDAYNLLVNAGATANNLARIDKNNDKSITEDELQAFVADDTEESNGTDGSTTSSTSSTEQTTEEKIAQVKEKYEAQINQLYEQIDSLEKQRINIMKGAGTAKDAETLKGIVDNANSVKSQIYNLKTQIVNTMANMEQQIANIEEAAAKQANSTTGTTGTTGTTSISGTDSTNSNTVDGTYTYTGSNTQFVNTFNNSSFKNGVLAGQGGLVATIAEKYGIDPNLLSAIMALETGWGTSSAIKNYNNPGGMMDPSSNWMSLQHYSSLSAGIEAVAKNLKNNYINQGLTTISSIGAKYCPVGAANDPNGTNSGWVPSVTQIYNQLTGANITANTKIA